MSRRFGRQQKKKMRSELLAKQLELDKVELAYEKQAERHASAIHDNRYARDMLINNTALLPPKVKNMVIMNPDTFRTTRMRALTDMQPADALTYDRVLDTVPMAVLISHCHQTDAAGGLVHFYAECAGGRMNYAISHEAIQTTPRTYLVNNIARVLSENLSHYLKEKFGDKQ